MLPSHAFGQSKTSYFHSSSCTVVSSELLSVLSAKAFLLATFLFPVPIDWIKSITAATHPFPPLPNPPLQRRHAILKRNWNKKYQYLHFWIPNRHFKRVRYVFFWGKIITLVTDAWLPIWIRHNPISAFTRILPWRRKTSHEDHEMLNFISYSKQIWDRL